MPTPIRHRLVDGAPDDPRPAGASRAAALWLLAGIFVCAFWLAGDLLRMPYVADDIDFLKEAALLRAGEVTWWHYLTTNHNEHCVPMMRMLYWATTFAGGLDAYPLRVAILGIHALCAWLLALLVLERWGSWQAVAVASVALGSVGFSSMPIWAPSTAVFSLSLGFLLCAAHQLLAGRRAVATLALAAASLSLNAAVLAFPIVAAAFWTRLGTTNRGRARWAVLWVGMGAMLVLLSGAGAAPASAFDAARFTAAGRNALFVVLSAPYRWTLAWTTGSAGSTPEWPAIAVVFAAWALAHLTVRQSLRPLVLMLSIGASLVAAAVGYGRWEFTPQMLYDTDRYYYWFGAPFAVVTVAMGAKLVGAANRPWGFGLIAAAACVSAYVQAANSLAPIQHLEWIQRSSSAADSARRLGDQLRKTAAASPLLVADGFVPVAGLHKDGLTLKTLSYSMSWRGIEQLVFVRSPSPEADRRLNAALAEWARQEGWPGPPVTVRQGELEPWLGGRIHFEQGAFASQIVFGFHEWDGHTRWMAERGAVDLEHTGQRQLRIAATAPIQALRPALSPGTRFEVAVLLDGVRLGTLDFDQGDRVNATFTVPAKPDSNVRITLESAFVWHARQILPGNHDPRELSISVEVIELLP